MRSAIVVLVLGGCFSSSSPAGDRPTAAAVVAAPVARGVFQLSSTVDITIEQLAPANPVATMRDFERAPGRTLLTLADEAGVPAVGTLRSVLPGSLESRVEGWLDEEIAKREVDGVPVPQLATKLVTYAETALARIQIVSALAIDAATATHTLAAIEVAPGGHRARFELGRLPGEIVSATAPVSSNQGTLAIDAHGYAIAYGEYAWRAVDAKITADHGAGIRATLGEAVSCAEVAARVARKCVARVCVGHEAELASICERGLDEVVSRAHAKVASFRFDALRFEAGSAAISADGDALTGGVWTAEINAGQGLRHAPATFTATR